MSKSTLPPLRGAMTAIVTPFDTSGSVDVDALERVQHRWGSRVVTDYSTRGSVMDWTARADLVIGAVLVAGDRAPIVVDRSMLAIAGNVEQPSSTREMSSSVSITTLHSSPTRILPRSRPDDQTFFGFPLGTISPWSR